MKSLAAYSPLRLPTVLGMYLIGALLLVAACCAASDTGPHRDQPLGERHRHRVIRLMCQDLAPAAPCPLL